eukprot:6104629-Pleurochrysis_carterae.AAC.2
MGQEAPKQDVTWLRQAWATKDDGFVRPQMLLQAVQMHVWRSGALMLFGSPSPETGRPLLKIVQAGRLMPPIAIGFLKLIR